MFSITEVTTGVSNDTERLLCNGPKFQFKIIGALVNSQFDTCKVDSVDISFSVSSVSAIGCSHVWLCTA